MSLARNLKETIQARLEHDPVFREELLKEGIECLLSGDVDAGKTMLRDYVNTTIGFRSLGGDRQIAQELDAHVKPQSMVALQGV